MFFGRFICCIMFFFVKLLTIFSQNMIYTFLSLIWFCRNLHIFCVKFYMMKSRLCKLFYIFHVWCQAPVRPLDWTLNVRHQSNHSQWDRATRLDFWLYSVSEWPMYFEDSRPVRHPVRCPVRRPVRRSVQDSNRQFRTCPIYLRHQIGRRGKIFFFFFWKARFWEL